MPSRLRRAPTAPPYILESSHGQQVSTVSHSTTPPRPFNEHSLNDLDQVDDTYGPDPATRNGNHLSQIGEEHEAMWWYAQALQNMGSADVTACDPRTFLLVGNIKHLYGSLRDDFRVHLPAYREAYQSDQGMFAALREALHRRGLKEQSSCCLDVAHHLRDHQRVPYPTANCAPNHMLGRQFWACEGCGAYNVCVECKNDGNNAVLRAACGAQGGIGHTLSWCSLPRVCGHNAMMN